MSLRAEPMPVAAVGPAAAAVVTARRATLRGLLAALVAAVRGES